MISVNDAKSIIQKNIFELKPEIIDLSESSEKTLAFVIKIILISFTISDLVIALLPTVIKRESFMTALLSNTKSMDIKKTEIILLKLITVL